MHPKFLFRQKANELRIGNIVSYIPLQGKYHIVIAIEIDGSVHLSGQEYPDDIRDIEFIKLNAEILKRFNLDEHFEIAGILFSVTCSRHSAAVILSTGNTYTPSYFHELQNIVFINTHQELLDMDEWLRK